MHVCVRLSPFAVPSPETLATLFISYVRVLSRVSLSATPWTVAHQASLSIGFPKNTRVGCHFLLQRIFPTQGSNLRLLCLLHW